MIHILLVSKTVLLVKYLVDKVTVIENTTSIIVAIVPIVFIYMLGVFIIRNYSICFEKPMLKTSPNKIPLRIETNKRMRI